MSEYHSTTVALVSNTSWNIYNFRGALIHELIKQNWTVFVFAPEDSYSESIRKWPIQFVPINIAPKGISPIQDAALVLQLYRLYKKHNIQLALHFTIKPNIYGAIAAACANTRTINSVTGLGTVFLQKNSVSRIAKWLYRIAFQFPEIIVFQNDSDRKLFISSNLVKASKAFLIPGSGVDTNRFKLQQYPPKGARFSFVLPARLLWEKGIEEFKHAAIELDKKYPQRACFYIIGAPESNEKFGLTVKSSALWCQNTPIQLIPHTTNMLEWYAKADVVVLPSYREGTSKVLLEAGSCGIPIITTQVPGCEEIVSHLKSGWVVTAKDSVALFRAMENALQEDPVVLQKMGAAGRKHIQDSFSESIVIQHYFALIQRLIQ